jgi:hypothetical protein
MLQSVGLLGKHAVGDVEAGVKVGRAQAPARLKSRQAVKNRPSDLGSGVVASYCHGRSVRTALVDPIREIAGSRRDRTHMCPRGITNVLDIQCGLGDVQGNRGGRSIPNVDGYRGLRETGEVRKDHLVRNAELADLQVRTVRRTGLRLGGRRDFNPVKGAYAAGDRDGAQESDNRGKSHRSDATIPPFDRPLPGDPGTPSDERWRRSLPRPSSSAITGGTGSGSG